MLKFLLVATPFTFLSFMTLAASTAPVAPPATTAEPVPLASPVPVVATGIRTFVIDARKSSIVIQVFKDGAAAALAHDHVVEAREFAGTIVADVNDIATAKVEVTAQTASLSNDEAKLRTKYGLDSEISDKDRAAVEEHMKGKDQLDIKAFPTVKFVSTSVTKDADGKATLAGKLTLHGVTRDVTMPLGVKVSADQVSGSASFRLKTSDYGIKPYSALLGAVKNKDEIVLHLHLVASAGGQ